MRAIVAFTIGELLGRKKGVLVGRNHDHDCWGYSAAERVQLSADVHCTYYTFISFHFRDYTSVELRAVIIIALAMAST